MKRVVMCSLCGKMLRYRSIILSVDERTVALKIGVAVSVFRCLFVIFIYFFLRCCEVQNLKFRMLSLEC